VKTLMFIITLLFSFKAICEENWTPISENEKSTSYIDVTSIVKVGKHSYFFWELVSYSEIRQIVTLPLEYPSFKESSRITLWEINCEEWFHYPVVEYSFSELMGKGIKIDTMNYTAPRWKLGEGIYEGDTGSSMYIMTKKLCANIND